MTTEIWAVDSETDPFKKGRVPRAFLWGAYNIHTHEWREWYGDDSTDQFISWARERDAIFYAHNGGKFDWMLGVSEEIELETPVMLIAGRLARFKVGLAEFRDSWNILPAPLAATGAKDEIDYTKLEREVRGEHMAEIRRYHKQDCIALADAIRAFHEKHGIRLTQAGAAMAYFEQITGKKADKTSKSYYERFEKYYFGGRVEVFRPGITEKPFLGVDINSAYPFAMLERHPCGTKYNIKGKLPSTDSEIGRCFITLLAGSTGAFPVRNEDKSLSFPSDGKVREFHITGWEYLAARDTDTLKTAVIKDVYTFRDSLDFKDYVIPLYEERKVHKTNGDEIQSLLVKLLLNSLYGKFAANPSRYKEYTIVRNESILDWRKMGWKMGGNHTPETMYMEKPVDEKRARYYNVATAASITGYVRAMLWRVIAQSDGVLYCDTDCVMAETVKGVEFDSKTLGAWDIEINGTFGAFAGKKLYAVSDGIKWKTASKGVRLEKDQIIAVAKGNEVRYEKDAPTFKRTIQKSGEKHSWIGRNVKRTETHD